MFYAFSLVMQNNISILAIEDSQGEGELFRLALAQTGLDFTLHTVRGAKEAIVFLTNQIHQHLRGFFQLNPNALATNRLPSLILLDLQLCGQHDCTLLKQLRTDPQFAMIPIVIFSTSDNPTDLANCYSNGANGYVVKPQTFDELIQCTADLCRYWLK